MHNVIVWLIIFSLIAVWFVIGYKISTSGSSKKYNYSNEQKQNKEYKKFIESATWKKIESFEPIQYTPESHDSESGGDDNY